MKFTVFVGIAWTVFMSAASFASVPDPEPGELRPNVLVIVLDDIGQEKLALYNPPVATPPTPNLSALSASGVHFGRVYSNPLCSPTRATIMTGRYAFRTGMGHLSGSYQLPLSEVTLAEALKLGTVGPRQYKCGAFGKWHMTTGSDYSHAIQQGFDKFAGNMNNVGNHFFWELVTADASGASTMTVGSPTGPFDETTFSASITRAEALSWLNAPGNRPFFAYVCFNAPHAPFQVPPLTTVSAATAAQITSLGFTPGDDLGGTPNDRLAYDWLIEAVDTEIGRLLAGIPSTVLTNTVILVVGDNGTPQPVIEEPPYDNAHAKSTVYEQGTRVPLIAKGRGISNIGARSGANVNTTDVWRTVLALANVAVPSTVVLDSISFKPQLVNPATPGTRTESFSQLFTPTGVYIPNPTSPPPLLTHARALNDGRYKYVRIGVGTPVEHAFDLFVDPLELNDLWPTTLPQILSLKNTMISLSGF